MAAEVLKSFGTLQSELEQARSSLKGVDENIKRLIGRDPSEVNNRPGVKRQNSSNEEARGRPRVAYANVNQQNFNRARLNFENDEAAPKRRTVDSSVFKRLSDRPVRHFDEFTEPPHKQQLISRVIVTPREIPSRQDVLAAQGADEKSKARNRRMFGALLGTLQKFRQEETKLKPKEEKRAQVEKKLEEQEIREKEEMKKERQDLFLNRKKKQAEIRMIELKMTRMKDHAAWEERQKPRSNFIITKSKPQIYYLPKVLNEPTKELLETCKKDIEKIIDIKRQEVYEELEQIEARMRNKFDPQKEDLTGGQEHEDKDEVSDVEMNEVIAPHSRNENYENKQIETEEIDLQQDKDKEATINNAVIEEEKENSSSVQIDIDQIEIPSAVAEVKTVDVKIDAVEKKDCVENETEEEDSVKDKDKDVLQVSENLNGS